jgi:hypothetical protein
MEDLYQNYVNNTVVNDELNVDKEWLVEIDLQASMIVPFEAYTYRRYTLEEFIERLEKDPIFSEKWRKI